jgi:flagellar L-ring protein precursor FlgH
MRLRAIMIPALLVLLSVPAWAKREAKQDSLLEYLSALPKPSAVPPASSPGSLWTSTSPFTQLATDYKAHGVGDVVTIAITEQMTAQASRNVDTQRSFSASSGIDALAGGINTSAIKELFSPRSDQKLQGKGQTSSTSQLQTRIAGQIVAVVTGGSLVVQAQRDVNVNNERQTVVLRGIARPGDISPDNVVLSTALANLQIEIKGKGVISDASRPPHVITRLLLKLLGF